MILISSSKQVDDMMIAVNFLQNLYLKLL